MKKTLLTLLVVTVVLGFFAAVGYTGYRYGYAQGLQASTNGNNALPGFRSFDDPVPRGMPMHRFGFERSWGPGGYPMMGFGFFSSSIWLWRIATLTLIVGVIYWFFARSGWRLTREPVASPASAENKPTKAENE